MPIATDTLGGFFADQYQPCRLLRARRGTVIEYEGAISHWNRYCSNLPISEITTRTLAEFAASLPAKDSPATVNKVLREVMAVLRFARKLKRIEEVPDWHKLREPRRVPVAFTVDEFAKILNQVETLPGDVMGIPARLWWRSLLLFLWYGGARISAMLAVMHKDVLLNDGGFILRAEQQKQHADQFLDVGQDAIEAARLIVDPKRLYFWSYSHRTRAAWVWFEKICAAAGVPLSKGQRFHRIRKSTASYLKLAGGDPTGRLGHSSPKVTEAYFDPRICTESRQARLMPRVG